MRRRSLIVLSFPMFLHIGCANSVKTDSQKTVSTKAPSSWAAAGKGSHGKISSGWLKEFQSPAMSRLVMEAVNNNPNLNATAARLRAARHGTIGPQAALMPRLNASTNASRSRNGNGNNLRSIGESYGLSLNASWEPDIWGRLRDLSDASVASYRASAQDYRSARLSLAGNTAQAYCDLVTAEQLVDLARKTLSSFQKNKDIVERNYKAGVPNTRAIAVQLSRSNVASAQRTLKVRLLQRDDAARILEQLLGRYPAASIKSIKSLPTLKNDIPTGIPANLVERRPDLIAAKLRVLESAKRADASAKNLLPSISLSPRASTSGRTPRNLLNPHYIAASIASSLTQSIYRGGELKANAKAALERNKAEIYDYANRAIRAFKEVEDAIAEDRSLRAQEAFLIKETKQATFAERSAELDYSEGIENSGIIEILESQRRANNARASLINLRNRRLQNRINLHLALGGDFYTAEK